MTRNGHGLCYDYTKITAQSRQHAEPLASVRSKRKQLQHLFGSEYAPKILRSSALVLEVTVAVVDDIPDHVLVQAIPVLVGPNDPRYDTEKPHKGVERQGVLISTIS